MLVTSVANEKDLIVSVIIVINGGQALSRNYQLFDSLEGSLVLL